MATKKKPSKKVVATRPSVKPQATIKQQPAVKKKTIATNRGTARRYTATENSQFIHVLAFVFTLLCFVFLAMAYYAYN